MSSRFGFNRVLGKQKTTPQAADALDVETPLNSNEAALDVFVLNLDATSANQLHQQSKQEGVSVANLILKIVRSRGKMHNPSTNSGGVCVGRVVTAGSRSIEVGKVVIPLCSLTAIPLMIDHITRVEGHQVFLKAKAIIYESLMLAEIPKTNFSIETLLAAVDVSRLVPQLMRTIKRITPQSVAVIGCGKSGLLALTVCRELLPKATLIALDISAVNLSNASSLNIGVVGERVDATNPQQLLLAVQKHAPFGADLVLNLVSVPNTEAGTALITRREGTIIYFSMAISFPKAVLSTDVTGVPLNVEIGAGVFPDAADQTISVLERNPVLAKLFNHSATMFYPALQNSQMQEFAAKIGLVDCTYDELHRWSVTNLESFYRHLYSFVGLTSAYSSVMKRVGSLLPQVEWFTGARENHAETLLRHSHKLKDKAALVWYEEEGKKGSMSFGQLRHEVAKCQSALVRLGIKKGDVVAAMLSNGTESVIAMLATTALGGIWSSLGPDLGVEILLNRFGQTKPKILIACSSYQYAGKTHSRISVVEQLAQNVPSIQTVVITSESEASLPLSCEWMTWNSFLAPHRSKVDIHFERLSFEDPVYILYTSGTTGPPKCIVQGFGVTLNHLKEHMLHANISRDDVVFTYTSLSWMMWNYLIGTLAIGCTVILYDGSPFFPKTESLWTDIIDREAVSTFFASARYLDTLRKAQFVPSRNLRYISSTGSTLAPETAAYFHKVLPETRLGSGSGGTELNGSLALPNPLSDIYEGGELCGPPLGMDVDVVINKERVKDEEGELACFTPAPNMPLFFLNDTNNARYRNSYFKDNDLQWIHGDFSIRTRRGGFFICGRSDSTLNPGGVRMGTKDYYSVVESIEGIADSVVVAVKNGENDDEEICLFVVLAPDVPRERVFKHVRETIRTRLSPKHVPKHIAAVTAVPVNLNMKKMEILVRRLVEGKVETSSTPLVNPESVQQYVDWGRKFRATQKLSKL